MPSLLRCSIAPVAALVFVACSGGGGSSPTAPVGAPSPPQVELDSFGLVNGAREANGVDPQLALRESIAAVARQHSEQMRAGGFFSHQDPQGRLVTDRLAEAGIAFSVAAENLARVTNRPDPARWAHEELMASGEHRPNILSPDVALIGVGVAREGNTYWITQVFIDDVSGE
ncbi:MAG: CAP domain-containing protein [Acidobacteriota bacterium]|nr:CAP domain-containing protein [Acidobacteriota bacterium]MDH3522016.1 CAP domain-containing protein [Acidobacteriota bacterium]